MVEKIPPSLLALLTDPPPSPKPTPSRNGDAEGFQPRSYFNAHGDLHGLMLKHGYLHDHGEYWVRPDKDPRDGHSAQFHADKNLLVVYTTDIPPALERLGKPTRGQHLSVTPYDFLCCYEFGGDTKACDRWIGQQYGPTQPPRLTLVADTPVETTANGPASLNLPAGFWESRPQFAHIRDAAYATTAGAFPLLLHTLVRTSALVSPNYRLPGLRTASVGTGTLDLMACIVGETGAGKSHADDVAGDLLPDPWDPTLAEEDRIVLMNLPPGSGEGLIDSYFENLPSDPDDPKSKKRWMLAHQGVHMIVDEGRAFASMAGRQGTTIVETMNQAWSGRDLGNANTRQGGRRRIIPAKKVRFACVLNIQSANAWKLFNEDMATVGFPGRLLFGMAADPDIPDPGAAPEWPGPLRLPAWALTTIAPIVFGYDDEITTEIDSRRLAGARGTGVTDERRSQHLLMQCKVAAILAVWDDRRHVTGNDWHDASLILSASSAILKQLELGQLAWDRDRRHSAATLRAESEIVVESVKERQGVASMAENIRRKAGRGIGTNQLRKAVCATKTKHRFEPALELAVANGWVTWDGERVEAL